MAERASSFRDRAARLIQSAPDRIWLRLLNGVASSDVSLADLGRRMDDYTALYRQRGVVPGDLVLIVLPHSLDLFASFFAGIAYGARPAFYAYPSPKQSVEAFVDSVRHLLDHNRAALVVTFPEVAQVLSDSTVTASLPVVRYGDVAVSDGPKFWEAPAAERECFLQFSSGTTGAKKGVLITAQALFNQLRAYAPYASFDSASTVVSWLPHYHDMGLIACMLMPFLAEVPIVMMSPFEWVRNPGLLLSAIRTYRGTHVWLPNFALGHLVRNLSADALGEVDLSTVRKLVLCSEPVQPDTVAAFLSKFSDRGLDAAALDNCYAMAENTFAMTSTRGGIGYLEVDSEIFQRTHRAVVRPGGRRIASAGAPLANLELRILDRSGADAPDGEVGEILISSDCMLAEYHHNPRASAEAFLDGWFRTGDLGFRYEGQLYVTGRAKDMVIVGGENIYPQDIEALLNATEGLIAGRNVVFGVQDDRVGTEKVVVVAEAHAGAAPDVGALRRRITDALNVAVADLVVVPHMSLRKGTAGKISRHLNKQAYLAGQFQAATATPAATSTLAIRDVVLELVPKDARAGLNAETPLISAGLIDSFGFLELIQRLERACGLKIPEAAWQVRWFDSIAGIESTIAGLRGSNGSAGPMMSEHESDGHLAAWRASLDRLAEGRTASASAAPWVERLINVWPLRGSLWYRWLFRLAGIQVGRNVTFLGRARVKIRGKAENIEIGDDVILGDGVDLRNRENGKIRLRRRAYLDHHVRIIAAREGIVDIGTGTEVGAGTVINSGGTVRTGQFCMIAGGVHLNSSRHGTDRSAFVKEQAHVHGSIELGDDVWIGAGASVLLNTRIGRGAVVSSNSLVSGDVPEFSISAGVPARVIQYR